MKCCSTKIYKTKSEIKSKLHWYRFRDLAKIDCKPDEVLPQKFLAYYIATEARTVKKQTQKKTEDKKK